MKTKKITDKIIDNRFKISGMLIVLLGIIGFFFQDSSLKEWIVTTNKLFCFWLNIKFFALILSTYELLLIITNNSRKLSFIATIVLAFSGTVQWNLNNIDSLVIGEIIVLLINSFFNKDELKEKIFCCLGIIIFSISYVFTFRPYAIAFGYVFGALIIWNIIKNKDKLKQNRKIVVLEILTFLLTIIGMISAITFFNNNNTEYIEVEGNGFAVLFTYLYNFLLPFYQLENRELFASILSVFPVPMFIALYYLYKNEKHIEFLLPISIVMVIESVFCMSGFPEIINNFSLFSQTNAFRVSAAVQLANFFVMFYFIGNVKEELFSVKHSMRITIVLACLTIFIGLPSIFVSKKFMYIFACETTLFSFLFLNFTDRKYQKVFLFFLLIFTLIGGVPIIFI